MVRRLTFVLVAALAGAALGCGGDDPEPPPTVTTTQGYTCEVDRAAIERGSACVGDADCPCGAHCAAGECFAACFADGECAEGQVCDPFGRCRRDEARIVAPEPAPRGRLVARDTSLHFDEARREATLTVRALRAAVAPVRIEAEPPVVIDCPTGVPGPTCALGALTPEDGPVSVKVRLTEVPGRARVFDLRIFGGDELTAVDARFVPQAADGPVPLAGIWRGVATLERAGSIARSDAQDTPDSLRSVRLPVELVIHEEQGNLRVVTLEDPSGFVFPESPTVGRIRRDNDGNMVLDYAARPFVTGAADHTDAARVLAAAESASVQHREAGLVVDLRTRFAGVVGDDFAPFVDWRLRLTRIEDLPEGATPPALPAPAEVQDPRARVSTPLAWQAAAEPALSGALDGLTGAARIEALLCTAAGETDPVRLDPDTASPWSGDLGCLAPAPDDLPRVFGPYRETAFAIAQTIGGCVSDLERAGALQEGLTPSAPPAGCIDAPRFALALAEAQALDRARVEGQAVSPDPAMSALAHRLVQQWVHMLAFVSAQAVQIDRLNDVLGASSGVSRDFTQGQLLELTAMGWDTLLHPRVAMPLTLLPGRVVRAPDYRDRLYPDGEFVTDPRHELTVGLPVALARSLSRSLEAHGALLERARYVPAERDVIEAQSIQFTRRSLVLFAFAALLYDYARATDSAPVPWADQWQTASSRLGVSISGLVRSLENLREGRNPLGIDDELDLPLYRVGDEGSSLERFSALTDYLLGAPGQDADSPVGAALSQAEAALTSAREAYAERLRTDLQYEINAQRQLTWENAAREEFGEAIVSLCGGVDLDADLIIEGTQPIDPETCWIRPDCRRTGDGAIAALHPEQVAYTVCYVQGLRDALGEAAIPARLVPEDEVFRGIAQGDLRVAGHTLRPQTISIETTDAQQVSVVRELFDPEARPEPPPEVSDELLIELGQRCRVVADATEGARAVEAGSCRLHGNCPSGYLCEAGTCAIDDGTPDEVGCFQGSVGETAAALRGAATDLEIARSELADLTRAYDLRMQACDNLIEANDRREAAVQAHLSTITSLDAAQLAADAAANVAAATKDCSNSTSLTSPWAIGVSCTAAGVEAAAKTASDGLQFAMDEATRQHEANIEAIDREVEERNCVLEAQQELVASNTASLRIRRALDEIGVLLVQLQNGKVAIAGNLAEGTEELAVQRSIALTPIEFDYFLDEDVVRYDAAFRRARRALYLGVLALEYEYQLSSQERTAVLAATTLAELQDIRTRLRNLSGTGTVGGASPSDLFVVLSLRDELLALEDRSERASGHTLSKAQRFQALLGAPRFAAFDDEGRYIGQRIPFSIAPLPRLGAEPTGAVPLLTGADCAERLFSVSASIQGQDVLRGTESSRTRVVLEKRNTFFSQWCVPPRDGPEFQAAATRPSRNLFLDPLTDYTPDARPPGAAASFDEAAEANAYTRARLTPEIGVTRPELEAERFSTGASPELAGRGIYGDYALFVPAESLARDGRPGLDLEAVDDVLLRLDYTSVAR